MFPPVPCSGDNDLFISYFYHGALIQLFIKNLFVKTLIYCCESFLLIGLAIDVYSPSFSILLLGRLFQGASTGIALPLMFHIILNFTPLEKRGTMMG